MVRERDIYTIGVVILGNFNPVILTPQWLSAKGLIRETESDTAKFEFIHPEMTRFEIDWLSVESTRDRIDFKTKRESHFSALRDLIVSFFSNLRETPIDAFGINHLCHFSMKDQKEYANFGYWLSPVEQFSSVLNKPKLLSVEYIETKSENNSDGVMRIRITPSDLLKDHKSVVFNCNHHFDNPGKDAKQMISLLVEKWEYSFNKTLEINNSIWEKAKY